MDGNFMAWWQEHVAGFRREWLGWENVAKRAWDHQQATIDHLREELAYFTELPKDYDCDCGVCNFCNGTDWRVWKQRTLDAEAKTQQLTEELAKRDRVTKAVENDVLCLCAEGVEFMSRVELAHAVIKAMKPLDALQE